MKKNRPTSRAAVFASFAMLAVLLLLPSRAGAQTLSAYPVSSGADYYGPPALGLDGNIYFTSYWGSGGYGNIFRETPSGGFTLLHGFNLADGRNPAAGLYRAVGGDFYGTTQYGGDFNLGTFFRLTPAGVHTVLYSFGGTDRGGDGGRVSAPVALGPGGYLWGTTENGGTSNLGTVFRTDSSGALTIVHSFVGSDGSRPMAGLVPTDTGTLLGTTWDGGAAGLGTVYEVTIGGTVTTLHSFMGTGIDGQHPQAALVKAGDGNFYGTTSGYQSIGSYYGGTVFRITPTGTLTTLHTFPDACENVDAPTSSLALGSDGKLYGTTYDASRDPKTPAFKGNLFRVDISGNYEVIYRFRKDGSEGCCNLGGLVQGSDGSFYGVNDPVNSDPAVGYFFRLSLPPGPIPTITAISPSSGASLGGTLVSITGTGFQPGATVTLGDVPAPVTSVTPTQISATTGPHAAGTVDVVVKNPDTGFKMKPCGYSYTCTTYPSALLSGSTTVCSGGATNLSVALTGTPPWTLEWDDGTVQSGISSSPAVRSVSPAATTTFRLTQVTDATCIIAVNQSVTVAVAPTPSAVITAPSSACSGAAGLAVSVSNAGSGATYSWTITNGTITSGAGTSNIVFTAGASGTVQLGVTVAVGSCSSSFSKNIPISALPTAAVFGGATICAGSTSPITVVLTGTPPWTLNWSDGAVQTGMVSSPATRNVGPSTTTTYTLTGVSDGTGCTGSASGSATITVKPAPNATITAPASTCPNVAGLVASVPDGGAGATYAWTITNGSITGGAGTRTITFTAGATGPVGLGVTVTQGGCPVSRSANVTVYTPPTATLSGPSSACAGANVPLSVALTGTGPWTVQWSDGYVQNASASPAVRNVVTAVSATYSLASVTGAGGCAGTVSGSVSLSIKPAPTAFVSGGGTFCAGAPVALRLDVTATGNWTANWSDGFVQTGSGSGTFGRDVAVLSTRSFSVVSITDSACSGITGGSAVVTILDSPSTSIESPSPVCARAGGLTASVTSPAAGVSYVWQIVGGTITSGQGTPSVTYTAGEEGTLTLSVTAAGSVGCWQNGALAVRVLPLPDQPLLTAPASTTSGATGLVAETPAKPGVTFLWTITNGEITSGNGTNRITFRAGSPGMLVLGVQTKSSQGCLSPEATSMVKVEGVHATRLVPVAVHGPGVGGAFFTTEMTLTNPGPSPVTAELVFTPSGGGGAPVTTRQTLPAGRQLVLPDVVGPSPGGSRPPLTGDVATSGSVNVTLENLARQGFAYVAARTTTPSGNGSAGVSYVAPSSGDLAATGVWVPGLRENATDRSNLAVVNAGMTGTIALRVTLYSGARGDSGRPYVLPDPVTLAPGAWVQLGSVLSRAGFANGYALVERISGYEPFLAYGVVNDNVTNDGSWLGGIPSTRTPGAQVLPVLAEAASFSSELVLTNPSAKPVTANLTFTESLAHPDGYFAGTIVEPLQPGEQRIIPGAIAYLRSRGMPIGAEGRDVSGTLLVIFSAGYVTVEGFAGVRTTSPAPGGGRYGVYSAALLPAEVASAEGWVFGLRQDGSSRTNLGLLNARTNLGPVTLAYDVFDGDTGVKVATSKTVTLAPGQWTQVNAVLKSYGIANGYVRVFRTAGSALWAAYGVRNDGTVPGAGTGDGSFLVMTLAP